MEALDLQFFDDASVRSPEQADALCRQQRAVGSATQQKFAALLEGLRRRFAEPRWRALLAQDLPPEAGASSPLSLALDPEQANLQLLDLLAQGALDAGLQLWVPAMQTLYRSDHQRLRQGEPAAQARGESAPEAAADTAFAPARLEPSQARIAARLDPVLAPLGFVRIAQPHANLLAYLRAYGPTEQCLRVCLQPGPVHQSVSWDLQLTLPAPRAHWWPWLQARLGPALPAAWRPQADFWFMDSHFSNRDFGTYARRFPRLIEGELRNARELDAAAAELAQVLVEWPQPFCQALDSWPGLAAKLLTPAALQSLESKGAAGSAELTIAQQLSLLVLVHALDIPGREAWVQTLLARQDGLLQPSHQRGARPLRAEWQRQLGEDGDATLAALVAELGERPPEF